MTDNYDLTEFNKVRATIEGIKKKGDFLPDMSTEDGYNASKRFVLDETTKARSSLVEAHKRIKATLLEACRVIDGHKNKIMIEIEAIQKPHKDAYKAVDAKKKEEKDKFESKLQDKIQSLRDYRNRCIGKSSSEIEDLIKDCAETDTQHGFYHLQFDATKARAKSLEVLEEALTAANRQKEIEERQKKERIEIEAKQAELRKKEIEIDIKQKSIESQQSSKNPTEREEKLKIYESIKDDLCGHGIETGAVDTLVDLISKGKIKHLTITY